MLSDLLSVKNSPICSGSGLLALDIVLSERTTDTRFWAGGSCGNVLTILSYLGWNSYPIARIGGDPAGDRILEDLRRWKVKTNFIEQDGSIESPIIIERIRIKEKPRHVFEMKCPECGNVLPRRKPVLLNSVKNILMRIPRSNVFYFDRVSPSIIALARHFRSVGALIVFEPNTFREDKLFEESLKLAHIVKHCYKQNAHYLDSSIPIEIQTMGENGLRYRSSLWEESMDWSYLKPYPVGELVDAAGAGDWCTAGIIHVLGQNSINSISRKRLETALNLGQCLAAINCHFEGARGSMYSISKHSLFSLVHTLMHRKLNEIETTKEILGSIRTASPENSTMQRICLCK